MRICIVSTLGRDLTSLCLRLCIGVKLREKASPALSYHITRATPLSKLCQGMCHHYGAWHVSPRLHIHRFRPWAPVLLPGVCFLTNAHGSQIAHFERFCSPAGWSCGTRA